MQKKTVLNEMIKTCDYFERNLQNNILFEPEFKASKKINDFVFQLKQPEKSDVIFLVELFNEVGKTEHYNGSGWMDYKMHLSDLLNYYGYHVEYIENQLRLT